MHPKIYILELFIENSEEIDNMTQIKSRKSFVASFTRPKRVVRI